MSDTPAYPRLSDAAYDRRHAQVRERMDAAGVQTLLLYGGGRSAEIHYLSNWRTTVEAWLVFPREGTPTLLVQLSNHLPAARRMAITPDVRFSGSGSTGSVDSIPSVLEALREHGAERGRVGLVGPVPWTAHRRLAEGIAEAELVDFSGELRQQRMVKSDEEIAWLRESALQCDASVAALAAEMRPGVSEHQLARIVEDAYLGDGGVNQTTS